MYISKWLEWLEDYAHTLIGWTALVIFALGIIGIHHLFY